MRGGRPTKHSAELDARLLADLRDVFDEDDAMHGETVLGALHKISEAPWVTTSAAR
jgi:hypothetical protein